MAPAFGDNWLLVGGQMVLLHEVERGSVDTRPTVDVDVVVDLRAEPPGLERLRAALLSASFEQDSPGPEGIAHRYRRGGAVIDVLAPDNLGARTDLTLGVGRTIPAPGATQALRRTGVVQVDLAGVRAEVRRPELVGALIGKAAAVTKISSQSEGHRAKHLRDFDSLARLLGPQDRFSVGLTSDERKMLSTLGEAAGFSELSRVSLRMLLRPQAD